MLERIKDVKENSIPPLQNIIRASLFSPCKGLSHPTMFNVAGAID